MNGNADFLTEGKPLDMRMNQESLLDGYGVFNSYDYHTLVRIFSNMERIIFKQAARKIEQAQQLNRLRQRLN